jgi:hypothetical protein
MTEETVMTFDKPHFTVKLQTTLLKVDLKEGFRRKIEEFAESSPHMRDTLGLLFQTVVPLDVHLKDIELAIVDPKGHAKVVIPHRRDITIPLEPDESKKLVQKLNELIPIEKARAAEELEQEQKAEREYQPTKGEMEKEAYRERMGRI